MVRGAISAIASNSIEIPGDRLPRRTDGRLGVGTGGGIELLHGDQPRLRLRRLDLEDRAAAGPHSEVRLLDTAFEILRCDIAPANDAQILQAAHHMELVVAQEAEVAGSQITAAVVRFQARPEHRLALLRLAPIALPHVRAGYPDLADPPSLADLPGVLVDDQYALLTRHRATAHQPPPGLDLPYPACLQRGRIESASAR